MLCVLECLEILERGDIYDSMLKRKTHERIFFHKFSDTIRDLYLSPRRKRHIMHHIDEFARDFEKSEVRHIPDIGLWFLDQLTRKSLFIRRKDTIFLWIRYGSNEYCIMWE